VKVREISKGKWDVEVTDEDKKKIACIVQKLRFAIELPPYGKWRRMRDEQLWEKIIEQFCVMGGAEPIERLMNDQERYVEFARKLSIKTLLGISTDRKSYISNILKRYKATRFHNKNAERIEKCLKNEEIVKDRKIALFKDLENSGIVSEDQIRDFLLKKMPFFKIKSVSDFMITIGAARGLIAFDTRIVGLLNTYFGLSIQSIRSGEINDPTKIKNKIQSNETLYKKIEETLNDTCVELGIELSLLDRILFAKMSAIEYVLKKNA